MVNLALWGRCEPYVSFPFNKQLPPVARINTPFEFVLSNETYKCIGDESRLVNYQTFDLPSWLNFDRSTRVFSGIPPASYLDSKTTIYHNFTLQGTDPLDNKSINTTYQLVITNKPGVGISSSFDLLDVLKQYGYTNGKNGLKLRPKDMFNIRFSENAFTNEDSIVAYYGRSTQYNSPLPNWIFFNSDELSFNGVTPVINSNIAPEIDYSFSLIATDFEGYLSTEINFSLVVGAHQLATSIENNIIINVTSSNVFEYDIPLNYIFLDNLPIYMKNISSIQLLDAPDWVSLKNITLSGTMPSSEKSKNFTIAIYDTYLDVVYLNFIIESTQSLFAISSFPDVNVIRGEWFQYSFSPSQFTDYDITHISISTGNASWITYKESNLTITGHVPVDFRSANITMIVQANNMKQMLPINIIGINPVASTSSKGQSLPTESVPVSSNTSTITQSSVDKNIKKSTNHNIVAIVCGITIPLITIAALVGFFIYWKYKKNSKQDIEKVPSQSDISENKDNLNLNPFLSKDPSMEGSSTAKRLNVLNVINLDRISINSSAVSSLENEKNKRNLTSGSSPIYNNMGHTQSTDTLLDKSDENRFCDNNEPKSSVCFNNEPTHRKSWRFIEKVQGNKVEENTNSRMSYASLNTVTTEELLNTKLLEGKRIPKDPKKSSLGMRDSVFGLET